MIVSPEVTFPTPLHDRLGLAQDPIFVSAHQVDGAQQFALVHSRPLSGESMYAFLHSSAPYRSSYQTRLHAAAQYASLGEEASVHSKDDFERRQERLHRGMGRFGIGSAFRAFAEEVRDEWIDALKEPSTDIYAPLTKMLAAYTDMGAAANAQIGRWKATIEQGDNFSDLAMSQSVSRLLHGYGLYTDRLEA